MISPAEREHLRQLSDASADRMVAAMAREKKETADYDRKMWHQHKVAAKKLQRAKEKTN